MRISIIVFFFLFASTKSFSGNYVYDYDINCQRAYQCYMSLQLEEGRVLIFKEFKANPYNLMATYICDYEDCLLLLFNGSRYDYEQRRSHFDERMALLNRGDAHSPWFRFCKAGVYMHWALVNFRMGENLKAGIAFRKSYLLVKENERLFPSFEYNKVFSGISEALAGTIPDNYKWIASVLGITGSVTKGEELLSGFINTHTANDPLQAEALIYYTYLRFYFLSQKQEAWDFVNSDQFNIQNNLLNCFVKINIALNFRKADAAIENLASADKNKGYALYPVFDYEMGSALLYKLDTACLYYFQRFLKNYKGTAFVKDTWQMMALCYYMQGKPPNARYCKDYIKKHGSAHEDADKQAQRFSETAAWPDKTMLEARMLTDGGYYTAALDKLRTIDEMSLSKSSEKSEYFFRLGRVCDELRDDYKALRFYETAIEAGRKGHEHFAARAALQMAFIYEREHKAKEALERYTETLSMHDHDFQSSIDQQAKAGINRLSGKN